MFWKVTLLLLLLFNLRYFSSFVGLLLFMLTFIFSLCVCHCASYGTFVRRGRSTPSRTPTRSWPWHSMTPVTRSCLEASTTTSRYWQGSSTHRKTSKWFFKISRSDLIDSNQMLSLLSSSSTYECVDLNMKILTSNPLLYKPNYFIIITHRLLCVPIYCTILNAMNNKTIYTILFIPYFYLLLVDMTKEDICR